MIVRRGVLNFDHKRPDNLLTSQLLVFFDRDYDDDRATVFLDRYGLRPCDVDKATKAVFGIACRHVLHDLLPGFGAIICSPALEPF